MGLGGRIKKMVQNWLEIQPSIGESLIIQETNTFEGTCFRNRLWYRGEASELHQYYTQVDDQMGNARFWSAIGTDGIDFRKIHTGLPGIIIDVLADIIVDALNDIEIKDNAGAQENWEKIAKDNDFKDIVKQAVIDVFIEHDGAFKINYNTAISKYPILVFYSGANVDYEYKNGRLVTIIFKNYYSDSKKKYLFREYYNRDGVRYELYEEGNDTPLPDYKILEETRNLEEVHDNGFMMATQFMINKSKKFKGRGQSILDKKIDDFDSFDEVWSQWIEALRDNKTQTYIPEDLLPVDSNGNLLKPNTWDKRFAKISGSSSEDTSDKIIRVSGDFDYEKMLQGYITALDLCLQGLISPSTLGIDTKKLDNAEAQREKEKVTQYTRNKVIRVLEKVLPAVAVMCLKAYDRAQGKEVGDYEATANFGEYSSPSFEAVVETISKARPGQSVMSIERSVEELYRR
ncbi:MAG: capsid protein [Clostridia bacterium]|nr:capsid protein [Clostridia bacterium]